MTNMPIRCQTLHNQSMRPVAIVGSGRIPFARSHTAYSQCSNQDMMSKALSSIVDRFEDEELKFSRLLRVARASSSGLVISLSISLGDEEG